jgi:large-conductance mechanosensitive channel
MTIFIRFILISIIIYLLIRSFVRYFQDKDDSDQYRQHENTNKKKPKGVSKEIGEYIDYEEVD